ncbi:MAG: galactokinase [Pirellulaceae bacterium]|nr:galactokinase [Pirellulaceae bacterium]
MKGVHHEGTLADVEGLAASLEKAGVRCEAAPGKASLFAHAAELLPRGGERFAFFVPGRVEVLGKHTDYAGGRTMVFAVEQGFAVVATARDDRRVVVRATATGESVEFALDPDLPPRAGHWANYPMTVARRVARNFAGPLRGAEIAFASDLPPAAGMSSSSALLIGMFLAFDAVNRLAQRPEYRANITDLTDLAGYLGTVENGQTFGSLAGASGVGTFGGSEDHTAILCGRAGHVSQYSYCPVRFERAVPIPPTHAFAIADSGVAAEKTGSAMHRYNAASKSAAALVELWRKASGDELPNLASVLESSPEAAERLRDIVRTSRHPDFDAVTLLARLEHFATESNQIVPTAGDALATGDLKALGDAVDRSQAGAERLLGNQVPETAFLAAVARRLGADAASAFGAGFGGSVWAMVEQAKMSVFLTEWQKAYQSSFPGPASKARFFATTAGPAAFEIKM